MSWLPKSTIIVPVDFSGQCVEAVRTAVELSDRPSGVHVLHVMVPMSTLSHGMGFGAAPVPDDSTRQGAAKDHLDEYIAENGLAGVTPMVRLGNPGEQVADLANELDADLIVMPSHGYHGVKRLLLGSVTERVLRLADCPVLVLRRPETE